MPRPQVLLFSVTLIICSVSHAAFKLKPGLWEVQTSTSVDGKNVNASQKMGEMMKGMAPAQRKQMEKMMGAKGVQLTENGVKVCHSEASMDENQINDPQNNCEIKDRKNLADGIKFDIHCKNGNGTAEYHRTSDTSYKGFNEFQTAKGKSRTNFTGKFVSADCGDVKPLQQVK